MLKLPLCKSHMTSGSSYVGRCWNMPWRAAQSLLREGKQGISSQWYIVLPLLDSFESRVGPPGRSILRGMGSLSSRKSEKAR